MGNEEREAGSSASAQTESRVTPPPTSFNIFLSNKQDLSLLVFHLLFFHLLVFHLLVFHLLFFHLLVFYMPCSDSRWQ